jgi:hypothetical protein
VCVDMNLRFSLCKKILKSGAEIFFIFLFYLCFGRLCAYFIPSFRDDILAQKPLSSHSWRT